MNFVNFFHCIYWALDRPTQVFFWIALGFAPPPPSPKNSPLAIITSLSSPFLPLSLCSRCVVGRYFALKSYLRDGGIGKKLVILYIPVFLCYIKDSFLLQLLTYLQYSYTHVLYSTPGLSLPRRPKARGLAQHGGPPGWLEECDPGRCDFLCDGRSMPLALTYHTRLPQTSTVMNYVSKACGRGTLADPCLLYGPCSNWPNQKLIIGRAAVYCRSGVLGPQDPTLWGGCRLPTRIFFVLQYISSSKEIKQKRIEGGIIPVVFCATNFKEWLVYVDTIRLQCTQSKITPYSRIHKTLNKVTVLTFQLPSADTHSETDTDSWHYL